ncbi:MAG TPA: type II toxin-antitoxin system VapC family toxin [Candidatus Dormibacteraeota bacterium]|jgi:PIN domain nuclease of toxin-antitoxin system|nr:type II toxin-antitoxin system VapC family toxin [Candidatus Dormibacteraeota bacterium]
MTLLLDTHALLWWLTDDQTLTSSARKAIEDPRSTVYVSAVTAWEIGIKRAIGKLVAPDDLEDQLRDGGLTEVPVTVADAIAAATLPRHHDVPFDRMLVAQAQRRGLTVVTRDRWIGQYDVPVLAA